MKKQYIIPIFVPHLGCPNDCIFCNQRSISGQQKMITKEEIEKTIELYLKNIKDKEAKIEVAFFGGSFTGIEEEKQGHVNIMEGTEKSALTGALTAIGVSFVNATAKATATVGGVAEAVAYAHAFVGAWGALAIPASIGINMLCNVISSGNGEYLSYVLNPASTCPILILE